jgi:hypothetical protein
LIPCEIKPHRAGRNQYYCLTDGSGAELWVQLDENEEIAGMNAHFDSPNSVEVTLLRAQAYEERPLDGTFEARALHVDSGLPPDAEPAVFTFDLPDAHMVPSVALPATAIVHLVAFAREIHCYETVEDFRKAHPGERLEGLHTIDSDRRQAGTVSSLMRLDGIVMQAKRMHNVHSGKDFYWMEVKTAFGRVDVVAATRSMPNLPSQGQFFDGQVRLSGRVKLKEAHLLKPGLMERFFWGAATNIRIEPK